MNIERAFGHLKGRFRRLMWLDAKTEENKVKIILTACVLHNICVLSQDDIEDFYNSQENANQDNTNQEQETESTTTEFFTRDGIAKRNQIINGM